MRYGAAIVCAVSIAAATAPASAQERPFVFSVSTQQTDTPRLTVHYDAGFGERAFDVVEGDQPEQRFGIQASLGHRLTFLARAGFAPDGRETRTSQQAELVYAVLHGAAASTNIAVGMGYRHESAGINVLTGRLAAGRRFDAWRVDGNALLEKPFSIGRDSIDLITSVGVARRVSRLLHVGVEAIGEDLEGFWDPNEAEGGARVLIGPSLRIASTAKPWQVSVAGGPVIHATTSTRASTALRSLPASDGRNGYAVRASLSYVF